MYGAIIMGIHGTLPNFIEEKLLAHPMICGVILFQKNCQSQEQVKTLIRRLKAFRRDRELSPLFIAIDHEGGPVQRLQGNEFTKLPSAHHIGTLLRKDPEHGIEVAEAIAAVTAYELGSLGIDLVLGPVLDRTPERSRELERYYGGEPRLISKIGSLLIESIQKKGLVCVPKHFPGTGKLTGDPHYGVEISQLDRNALWNQDLFPYKKLCARGCIKALMLSHFVYIQVDEKPVPASYVWIQKVLRFHMNYKQAILTDCLQMAGASLLGKTLNERIFRTLANGCDVVMASQVERHSYHELYTALHDPKLQELFTGEREAIRQSRIKPLFNSRSESDFLNQLCSEEYRKSKRLLESVRIPDIPTRKRRMKVFISRSLKKVPFLKRMGLKLLAFYGSIKLFRVRFFNKFFNHPT